MRKILLIACFGLSAGSHASESAEVLYSSGKFSEAWASVKKDLTAGALSNMLLESKLQLALEIAAQRSDLPLAEVDTLLAQVEKKRPSAFVRQRLASERMALTQWKSESELNPQKVETELRSLEQQPRGETSAGYDHARQGQLAVLNLLLARKIRGTTDNPEWLYYLGWGKELESNSGRPFLEDYLKSAGAQPSHRAHAQKLLRTHATRADRRSTAQ